MRVLKAYVPVDISGDFLKAQADALREDFPKLRSIRSRRILPHRSHCPMPSARCRRSDCPGSTLGNFEPHEACGFLRSARDILGQGAQMVIGVDLEKDERVLSAYNDKAGVTARFDLNVLQRINRELGGNFELSAFRHHAIYNRERHRIEMHLISRRAQTVACWAAAHSAPAKPSTPRAAINTAWNALSRWRAARAGPARMLDR